jgi:hypothetical protein
MWGAPLLSTPSHEGRRRLNPRLVARFYPKVGVRLDFSLVPAYAASSGLFHGTPAILVEAYRRSHVLTRSGGEI